MYIGLHAGADRYALQRRPGGAAARPAPEHGAQFRQVICSNMI